MIRSRIARLSLIAVVLPQIAQTAPNSARDADFEGFDFAHVVEAMETSVNPLKREMDLSFRVFIEGMGQADQKLDEGELTAAVHEAAAALDAVLKVREDVIGPMWEGQTLLTEQIASVRARLAEAAEAADEAGPSKITTEAEATLDRLAQRIGAESDPMRRERLEAHYRAVRSLARIRSMAVQLTPDQREMWMNVLGVLEEAALAHQQVLIGSEILFAQFDATAENLRHYVELIETLEGASQLMAMVRGADGPAGQLAGMNGFAAGMADLQERLGMFNESVEQALTERTLELESEIGLIDRSAIGGQTEPGEDRELAARIARLNGTKQTPGGDAKR